MYIYTHRQLLTAYDMHIAVYIGRAINGVMSMRGGRQHGASSAGRRRPGTTIRRSVRCKQRSHACIEVTKLLAKRESGYRSSK